jgi:hypothetical protein
VIEIPGNITDGFDQLTTDRTSSSSTLVSSSIKTTTAESKFFILFSRRSLSSENDLMPAPQEAWCSLFFHHLNVALVFISPQIADRRTRDV